MYYAAFKSIQAGTELLLHYGTEYAEVLNIDYIRPDYYYAHGKFYFTSFCTPDADT